jgi:CRISPR-associated protein Csb1
MTILNLELLDKAVSGEYAGIRRTTRLEPQGEKIFPPTYEGGDYADEKRLVHTKDESGNDRTEVVETVLLDSVQSQANRLELALLHAYDNGRIRMPMLQVDFGANTEDPILRDIGRLTALETPHRMCDAIFRNSVLDGKPFRDAGAGASLNSARSANATPVFSLCPTALLFGFWDSTGPRGGLGPRMQRALVSEIVGYQGKERLEGKRPASRIGPIEIEDNVDIYRTQDGGWTLDKGDSLKKIRPSEINLGNIPPSFYHEDKKTKKRKLNHGGVTLDYAVQHVVLSLAALRRLRFPINGETSAEIDNVARTVLAALGLAAICFLDEDGYDLRSRCLLDGKPGDFEFVGHGEHRPFALNAKEAAALLGKAVEGARSVGLPWPETPVTLQPSANLAKLVSESRRRSMLSEPVEG